MRSVIVATGEGVGIAPLTERMPVGMLPLLDRPLLQHQVEYLVSQGIKQFDFVLHHWPEKIEQYFGDGQRWGCQITYHLARDPERPYWTLKTFDWATLDAEPFLLCHGDRFVPFAPLPSDASEDRRLPRLYSFPSPAFNGTVRGRWTGWAILNMRHLSDVPKDADERALVEQLSRCEGTTWIEVKDTLCYRSFADILDSHRVVLDKQFSGLLLSGREADPNIWLSRNVMLHPTVQVFAPVYIGQNCAIEAGVKLGPHAVIGSDSVLDSRCTVTNSVILPGSYVGEALELNDVIIDKNRLINARVGAAVLIADDFILGSMSESRILPGLQALVSRLSAALLVVALAPLFLLVAIWLKCTRRGPLVGYVPYVRLPADSEDSTWQRARMPTYAKVESITPEIPCSVGGFLLRFLPALINIVWGELSFVGVPPRDESAIKSLPPDWQSLYLKSKTGIVTESAVRYFTDPTEEERYAAEAYYAVTAGWKYDLQLLFRYFYRMLLGVRPPRDEHV